MSRVYTYNHIRRHGGQRAVEHYKALKAAAAHASRPVYAPGRVAKLIAERAYALLGDNPRAGAVLALAKVMSRMDPTTLAKLRRRK